MEKTKKRKTPIKKKESSKTKEVIKETPITFLGLDLGTSSVKGAFSTGERYKIDAVVNDAEEIWERQPDYIEVFHNGVWKFIGKMAIEQSQNKEFELNNNKVTRENTIPLLKGLLAKSSPSSQATLNLKIVATLPFDADAIQKKALTTLLESLDGEKIKTKIGGVPTETLINIKEVRLLSEGQAAFLNLVLDNKGELVEKATANQKVLVGDIGLYHLNLVVIDRMTLLGKPVSRSLSLGLTRAHQLLNRSLGGLPLWQIDQMVKDGEINKEAIAAAFSLQGKLIEQEVRNLGALGHQFKAYYWTGGGAKAIYDYINLPNKIPLPANFDGSMDNANGALKVANRIWGQN